MTCMKRWSRAQLRHERRAGLCLGCLRVLAELPRLSTVDSQQLCQTIAARATAGVKPANLLYQARLDHYSMNTGYPFGHSLCLGCLHLALTSCWLHIADSSQPNDFQLWWHFTDSTNQCLSSYMQVSTGLPMFTIVYQWIRVFSTAGLHLVGTQLPRGQFSFVFAWNLLLVISISCGSHNSFCVGNPRKLQWHCCCSCGGDSRSCSVNLRTWIDLISSITYFNFRD